MHPPLPLPDPDGFMIVFALRHADKPETGADDLSPAGIERAELLARMLADSGIRFAFRSDAVRAARTLAPLKEKLGSDLTITEVAIEHPFESAQLTEHVNKIVVAVNALPADAVVAVVSHSNTVPRIVKGLGGGIVDTIKEKEFDRLFVLLTGPAGKTLLRLRYGAAT
jgi:phosphohistidine phosphatase SixA